MFDEILVNAVDNKKRDDRMKYLQIFFKKQVLYIYIYIYIYIHLYIIYK